MAVQNSRLQSQEVKTVRFLPQDAGLEPLHPAALPLSPGISTVIAQLFGQTVNGGKLVTLTLEGALQTSSYGSGFVIYDTKTDTAPASYSTSHQLQKTSGRWQQFDILVEAQEAVIRFYDDAAGAWLDDIPLTIGNHSIAFCSSTIQVKKRGATAGTYTIVGWA
jgi:hypothetical protein